MINFEYVRMSTGAMLTLMLLQLNNNCLDLYDELSEEEPVDGERGVLFGSL